MTDASGHAVRATYFYTAMADVAALADRLALLAGDPELRRRLGDAGRRRVAARFSLGAQTDAFIEFFAETVERRRRRST